MMFEVKTYNEHIEAMSNGTAPESCYSDLQRRIDQCLARRQEAYSRSGFLLPGNRGLYEKWDVHLRLVDDNGTDVSEDDVADDWITLKSTKPSFDKVFFCDKYAGEGFCLGMGLLPMTQRVFDRMGEYTKSQAKRAVKSRSYSV